MVSTSATGIPVDYLFLVIGALLSGIYLDVKRDLRTLRNNAQKRDLAISRVTLALRFVCRKLNIPFDANDDSADKDEG